MKKIVALTMICVSLLSCSNDTKIDNQTISGYIENNNEYRGGANPPQFILDDLEIYHPSANQTFYVRNAVNYMSFTSVITSFVTDANGNYNLILPEGSYAIISQEKYDYEQNPLANSSCDYLQQPDFVININLNQQNYFNQYTSKLNYCIAFPN